ncbi:stAR-related lipid transfer protein 6 isoform X2 [Oxyura jamaicensis]|uniref:stAR-related lipid transfer protein 6 isoform X2 n=1 Tax=Oxyura jamaicensis TaxID=8884 RepID=UPI0015A4F39E|nr:stAR-related lipid transfer protein 6 isoform X2 [Oxyura jamaicensis]
MDYKKITDEISEKILSYSQDTSGWRVIKVSKNVTVSSKPSKEYAGNIYRGEGIIEEVPSKIIPFMYLPEYRNKWDKALKSYSLLESIDQLSVWNIPTALQLPLVSEAVTIPVGMCVLPCLRIQSTLS